MKRTLSDLGEKRLLRRLSRYLGHGANIVRTFSEDCAVIDAGGPNYLLYTVDAFVEGVHFKRDFASPYLIGRKALAVNVSDISAMGGRPLYYLISLMAPPRTGVSWIDELYRGLDTVAREARVKLVGGNVTRSNRLVLDLFVAGEVSKGRAVFRDGARKGDAVFVSGALGGSAAGLRLLRDGLRTGSRDEKALLKAHLDPPLRLDLARLVNSWANSMIDLSDGLATDLREICRESGVGAVIRSQDIPIAKPVLSVFGAMKKESVLSLALGGGEDYELLFTVSPQRRRKFLQELQRKKRVVFEVGTIVEKARGITLVNAAGVSRPLRGGFEHFTARSAGLKE